VIPTYVFYLPEPICKLRKTDIHTRDWHRLEFQNVPTSAARICASVSGMFDVAVLPVGWFLFERNNHIIVCRFQTTVM